MPNRMKSPLALVMAVEMHHICGRPRAVYAAHLPAVTSPRGRVHLTVKRCAMVCLMVAVAGCKSPAERAATERADSIGSVLLVSRSDGARSLVVVQQLEVRGRGKNSQRRYHRLDAIDLATGERRSRHVVPYRRGAGAPHCAPGPAGSFWCVNGPPKGLVMRDADTLEVRMSAEQLETAIPALKRGVHRVHTDEVSGELIVTTGDGNQWVLSGSKPTARPGAPDRGHRQVGTRPTAARSSRFAKKGERLEVLVDVDKTAIEAGGIALATLKQSGWNRLTFVGLAPSGERVWTRHETVGRPLRAFRVGARAVVVIGQRNGSYALAVDIATGAVHWRYAL